MAIFTNLILLLLSASRLLNKKFQYSFLIVILASILSPLLDLGFFKILASLFSGSNFNQTPIFEVVLLMVVILAVINMIKYLTKVKKVEFVNKVIESISTLPSNTLGGNINWLRVVILESTNALISIAHIFMIALVSCLIHPLLGSILLITILISFIIMNYMFNKEVINQKKLRYNKKITAFEKGEKNIISRIKSSEKLTVMMNIIVLIFFVMLIYFHSISSVEPDNALIFLFITRFISSNLSNLASSFMRISRAWGNVFDKFDNLVIATREQKNVNNA